MKREKEFKTGMMNLRNHSIKEHEGIIHFGGKYQIMACSVNPFIKDIDVNCDNIYLTDVKVDKPFFDKDWKKFWGICKEHFPLHSVCGCAQNVEQIYDVEEKRIADQLFYGTHIKPSSLKNKRVLEIGYGFGRTGLALMRYFGCKNYYGIDYVSSDKELLKPMIDGKQHFFEIDKSGIPSNLMKKYDLIYSLNVMQHLTKEQRKEYFTQIAQCLTKKGKFIFDCFEWNYETKGDVIRDDYNTKFFGVKTSIETKEEMEQLLDECGLKIQYKIFTDKTTGLCNGETNTPLYVIKKK